MYNDLNYRSMLRACDQTIGREGRYLNTNDINVAPGYRIEVYAEGLNSPSSLLFLDDGTMIIADSGYITGNPSISRQVDNHFEIMAEGFNVPLIGITYRDGNIYAAHGGTITLIRKDGTREDIITGLPSNGDYSNCRVAFGTDNKMYFGLGTATNSGVVGNDNLWLKDHPRHHDYPGGYILLRGQNFKTDNVFLGSASETILTGAFSAYGEANSPNEIRKGVIKASGSILRSNLDGTEMELVAWGLRSVAYIKFDEEGRLFVSNNGYDIRGSRPIANAPDEFHIITPGIWYGWPDYAGGQPVTLERFRPEGREPVEFLLLNHPNVPPEPFAKFPPESTIIGFDFNNNSTFGRQGDVYIAEFGSIMPRTYGGITTSFLGTGHRISRIDMFTGGVSTFAINKSGFSATITREGGFGRPADIAFGPDGAMYIVDMGMNLIEDTNVFIPNTGVIWRISRA